MLTASDPYFASLRSYAPADLLQKIVDLINESPLLVSQLIQYGGNIGLQDSKTEGGQYTPSQGIILQKPSLFNTQSPASDLADPSNKSGTTSTAGIFVGRLAHELGHYEDPDMKQFTFNFGDVTNEFKFLFTAVAGEAKAAYNNYLVYNDIEKNSNKLDLIGLDITPGSQAVIYRAITDAKLESDKLAILFREYSKYQLGSGDPTTTAPGNSRYINNYGNFWAENASKGVKPLDLSAVTQLGLTTASDGSATITLIRPSGSTSDSYHLGTGVSILRKAEGGPAQHVSLDSVQLGTELANITFTDIDNNLSTTSITAQNNLDEIRFNLAGRQAVEIIGQSGLGSNALIMSVSTSKPDSSVSVQSFEGFQTIFLGNGIDKVRVDQSVSAGSKILVAGGGTDNEFIIEGGNERLIGGAGNNTFQIDNFKTKTSQIIWGGTGKSTYYIDGSPTVYLYYIDNPTAAKIAALSPELINSAFPAIKATVNPYVPGYASDFSGQPINPSTGAIYIINPGDGDRIFNNGVLLSDFTYRVATTDFGYSETSSQSQSVFTSRTYEQFPQYNASSNYVWFENPTSKGAPGPDAVQSFPTTSNGSLVPGLTIANFKNHDFGITYSGRTDIEWTHAPWVPDPEFVAYNSKLTLDVQTSDENGSQLNSDNGSLMSGSGAVTYTVAADTPTSLISSRGGEVGGVVAFAANVTPGTLNITGGGGSDGLGLVLQDQATGHSVTVLDGLGAVATRIASVSFSDGESLSYADILQTLTTASATQTKLYGDGDANILDSRGLANYAQGNGGGDTFAFAAGYGALEINETDNGTTPNNVLKLGSGIVAAQLTVTADATGNLYLGDGTSGDRIQIDNQLNGTANGIQSVTFADGSSMTAAQLVALETTGTNGPDALYGSIGSDVFDGQGAPMWSQDYEQGNGGGDTFVYNVGYGRLEINEIDKGSNPSNVLQFGAGIDTTHLTVTGDYSGNLYLSDGTPGDQIQLDGQLSSAANGIQTVAFADGSSLTASQLILLETTGTTGADTLFGSSGADVLDGKGAPSGPFGDQAIGNGGGDIFVYRAGYGQLAITEYDNSASPHNVLQLGAGITAQQLTVTADPSGSVVITDGTLGDQIRLYAQLSGSGVQLVTFADGTSLTAAQLADLEMTGTSGADTLIGTAGADVLDGKGSPAGSQDYAQGNGGGDTFVFNAGYGQLEINEYVSGSNTLQLGSGIAANQLSVSVDGTGSILLADGIAGDLVKIDAYSDRGPGDVPTVIFADGTSLTKAQLQALATTGTSGADTLFAPTTSVTFDGKGAPSGAQDLEVGKGGSDTFIFNAGYGQLEITENGYGSDQNNVLQLGPGITISQMTVSHDSVGRLYLKDGIQGDQIRLDDNGLQAVRFADGSTLSYAQLVKLSTVGTSGADTMSGLPSADFFDGKGAPAGSEDLIHGNGGGDTFVFNQGYGQLEIDEQDYFSNPSNIVQFGPGIVTSQIAAHQDALGNLYLTDGISGDVIKIDQQGGRVGLYNSGVSGIQGVAFSDGSSLTAAQLATLAMAGTSGADTIYGTAAAENIDGKGAPAGQKDYEQGGGGSDTFVFNQGYGQLEISESGYGQSATLRFGPGINASQITVHSNKAHDLFIADGTSGDQIVVDDQFVQGNYYGVGSIQFDDGSSLSSAQLAQMVNVATAGPDGLTGTSAAEVFDGKGAPAATQDYVEGGGGGDTFVFNRGYGQLEIKETDYGQDPANSLQFGPGITPANVTVRWTSSTNMSITDGTSGDQVVIDNQYYGYYYGVQSVSFADGSNLSAAQLQTLALQGFSGADRLFGTFGADVLDGMGAPTGASDYLNGSGGSDTFVFGAGYGHLEIDQNSSSFWGPAPNSTLQFGAGISASQLTAYADEAGDLIIDDGIPGDEIQLDGQLNDNSHGVQSATFTDGSSLDSSQLVALTTVIKATLVNDTGIAGDSVTSDATVSGVGTGTISLSFANSQGQTVLTDTATADRTRHWSYSPANLPDGSYTVTATQTDASQQSSSATLSFVLDGAAPSVGLSLSSDTGRSSSDRITSVAGLVGSGDANATVTVSNGSTALGSTTADAQGHWSFSPSSLADGSYTLTAAETDLAGNTGSAALTFVLDTTAPAVTEALANDTGASNSDKVTSSAILSGGGDANATVTIGNGSTVLGTTTADAQGHWSFAPSNLTSGSYTLTAREVDAAGNSGIATLSFILDTTAPATTVRLASDTGSSSSDRITSSAALSGTGDANATVTISNGATALGTTTADSQGRWSIVPSGLADGSYTLTAKETDAAGNSGSASLSFVLDSTAPATTIGLSNDTGSSNTDRITSSAALTGGGDAGATVTIRKGTTVLGTTTADSAGLWSFSPTGLSNGSNTLTATEVDTAGNSGTGTIAITLDTIAPKPAQTIITGISGGGVTLAGTSEVNSTVTVTDTSNGNTTTLGTVTTAANGYWSLTSNAVVDVTKIHTYATTSTDVAGNSGAMAGKFYLASTGNDTLTSNANVSDVFAIMSFKGTDIINGFEASSVVGANHDYIDFSGRGITSFSQVQSMMSGSTSTIINIGSGKTITLSNIAPSALTAADFRYS